MLGSAKVKKENFAKDTARTTIPGGLVYDSKIGAKVFQGWKRYEEAEEEE